MKKLLKLSCLFILILIVRYSNIYAQCYDIVAIWDMYGCLAVDINDSLVFVGSRGITNGFQIINFSNIDSLELEFEDNINPYDIEVIDSFVFCLTYHEGLYVYKITDSLYLLDSIYTPGRRLFIEEDWAFTCKHDSGYNVIDISNPYSLELVYHSNLRTTSLFVKDTIMYHLDNNFGLRAFNISLIDSPILIDSLMIGEGNESDITIFEDIAYIPLLVRHLIYIISLTPTISLYDSFYCYYPYSIDIYENYLYVTCMGGPEGIAFFDISDPLRPDSLCRFRRTGMGGKESAMNDSLAFVSMGEHGLFILDISGFTGSGIVELYNRVKLNSISIYPNPFNKCLNIDLNKNTEEVQIYSINGKFIESLKNKSNNRVLSWEPKSVPSGIYFLKIFQENKVGIYKTLYLK